MNRRATRRCVVSSYVSELSSMRTSTTSRYMHQITSAFVEATMCLPLLFETSKISLASGRSSDSSTHSIDPPFHPSRASMACTPTGARCTRRYRCSLFSCVSRTVVPLCVRRLLRFQRRLSAQTTNSRRRDVSISIDSTSRRVLEDMCAGSLRSNACARVPRRGEYLPSLPGSPFLAIIDKNPQNLRTIWCGHTLDACFKCKNRPHRPSNRLSNQPNLL
jgi:hypothetical protein